MPIWELQVFNCRKDTTPFSTVARLPLQTPQEGAPLKASEPDALKAGLQCHHVIPAVLVPIAMRKPVHCSFLHSLELCHPHT